MPAFDDPVAYRRRWGHLTADHTRAAADADPLLFLADHIDLHDRLPGSVAGLVTWSRADPTIIIVPDGPEEPSRDACREFCRSAMMHLLKVRQPSGVVPLAVGHCIARADHR